MSILLSSDLLGIIIYIKELNLPASIFKNNYIYYRPRNDVKEIF
jgi:hypothetical protein